MKVLAQPIKVLVADDNALYREGLAHMLAADPRVEVVGQACDGEDAVRQALALRPHAVLMSVDMPTLNGIDATRRLAQDAPDVYVLALTAYGDNVDVGDALANGARQFFTKEATMRDVIASLVTVAAAGSVSAESTLSRLSSRELHVLRHVAIGFSNKQVARRLGISQSTVRNHLTRIFRKLGVMTRTEAVVTAIRSGHIAVGSTEPAVD
jgi:DNA-binding NarL/FixJ family response regulator